MPKEICPEWTDVSLDETSKGDFPTAKVSKSYNCKMGLFYSQTETLGAEGDLPCSEDQVPNK
ncbi:hypothetical protein Patl1_10694 [Pistacia atlantica]|uniref:Uncharacterized protein n=1 Tax=Pistacia atlantica TaxID=434234 RepID=A0ACC1A4X7_9ROSI|nr:hypothetical protein Patl1_10694 [Pistacia atlantica]